MSWKAFDGSVVGLTIEGDPTVPATTKYNLWPLKWFVWKKVVVLKVDGDALVKNGTHATLNGPLRFGFRNAWGQAQVNETPLADTTFRALVGRESFTGFVVDGNGKELLLRLVTTTTKSDRLFKKFPLI